MNTVPLDDVLTTDLHVEPGACRLRLRGELDLCSCRRFAAAVDQALGTSRALCTSQALVVDLHDVSFCDLDGLRALESARRTAPARGVELRCHGLSPLLRRIAPVAGCDGLLPREAPASRGLTGAE